jgi:uncharacterized membrane protein (DUF485 family)
MAVDVNFLFFLMPSIVVVLAALLALPSKDRIERDPSTAFQRGRRAFVNLATVFALFVGLVLVAFAQTLNLEPLVASINMVHVGGVSLLAMGLVLLASSIVIKRWIKGAGKGYQEEVVEVAALGVTHVPHDAGEVELEDRPYPPPRGPPVRDPERRGPPPPRRLDRYPPPHSGPERRPPPPYGGPERRPPPPREGARPPPARPRRRPPPGEPF